MSSKKLFVRIGGLDNNFDPKDRILLIQEIFKPVVEILEDQIQLIQDRERGGYRNFCFVTLEKEDQVSQAIEQFDGSSTGDGYQLSVSVARPKENNNFRSGQRFGSYFGGRNS